MMNHFDFSEPQRFFYRIVFRKSGNKAFFVQSGKGTPVVSCVLMLESPLITPFFKNAKN